MLIRVTVHLEGLLGGKWKKTLERWRSMGLQGTMLEKSFILGEFIVAFSPYMILASERKTQREAIWFNQSSGSDSAC